MASACGRPKWRSPARSKACFLDAGAPIEIDAPGHGRDVADALAAFVAKQKVDPKATLISFGLDPLGAIARRRRFTSLRRDRAAYGGRGQDALFSRFRRPILRRRCAHRPCRGAARRRRNWPTPSPARWPYLRALEGAGLSLEAAAKAISFRLAIDADEFLGVCKTARAAPAVGARRRSLRG